MLIFYERFMFAAINTRFSILDLLLAFKWLVCYYLKKTYQHVNNLKSSGMSDFYAKNNSQAFLARTLSLVYGEVSKICVCISFNWSKGSDKLHFK